MGSLLNLRVVIQQTYNPEFELFQHDAQKDFIVPDSNPNKVFFQGPLRPEHSPSGQDQPSITARPTEVMEASQEQVAHMEMQQLDRIRQAEHLWLV